MEKTITVAPIETKFAEQAQDTAIALLKTSKALEIKTQIDYDSAAEGLKKIKGVAKDIEAKRKEITKPLDQAKKAVMDLFRNPLALLNEAEYIVKNGLLGYTEMQEKKRREQQEKLDRQARAEEDRKKKALEEQARKQEEKAAEARKNAQLAENEAEKKRLEEVAKKAEEEAEKRRDKKEEVKVEAPVLAPQAETPSGISYKIRWTAEVVDFKLLPNEYKLPNMPILNKMAQATKGKVPIPGVKFNSEKDVSSRSK